MNKLQYIISILEPFINMNEIADELLDKLEEIVTRSDNKIDDYLVLPIIKSYRKVLSNDTSKG